MVRIDIRLAVAAAATVLALPASGQAGSWPMNAASPTANQREVRCRNLPDGISAACFAKLERRYLDREVPYGRSLDPRPLAERDGESFWWPPPRNDRIFWRDVFADPLALRRAVHNAANQTRCQAMPGEAPHHLRAACAADAFARLSVLHRACGWVLNWAARELVEDRTAGWEWLRRREPAQRYLIDEANPATLEERDEHFAWRLAKCRQVPPAALAPIEMVRPPYIGFHRNTYDQARMLEDIAARLGSAWANSMPRNGGEANATAKANLAFAYVRLIRFDRPEWQLPLLLAARMHDLESGEPQLDWRGLPRMFAASDIEAAMPTAMRLHRQGWQPLPEREDRDLTWPWAIAPPVVETQYIARRNDRYGNVRWVYPDGGESWFRHDGSVRQTSPGWDEIISENPQIATEGVAARRWTNADGSERWADKLGHEHWLDEDGAEHWIDWRGTEWILLPIGVPFPADSQ